MLSTRHLLLTAVPTLALLLAAGPATAALDIVFGADAAGLPAGTGALPSGRTLVVSGPVLQLRLPGGGTVSLQQGAEFSVSEGPGSLRSISFPETSAPLLEQRPADRAHSRGSGSGAGQFRRHA